MDKSQKIRVVARGSRLSLLQVEEVFKPFPDIDYQLEILSSLGDKNKQQSLLDGSSPSDFFTRELDQALSTDRADIAIHSAKDLPYPLPAGLEVIALFNASDPSDSLVSREHLTLLQLPAGARVGTSSPMRKKNLQKLRPDLTVVGIRGTIEERIALVDKGEIDALIVATCALKRLGLESRIAEVLPFETHPLQGFLAITALLHREDLRTLFSAREIRSSWGKVTLVGFGPGNPDFLTLAGERAIREADILFYDDLLDASFLDRYKAQKLYVGKRSGKHYKQQDEINVLLLEAARSGKQVVRLKGGDPMIFAHAGEEIEYLQSNLIEVTVIPGITTASALAALSKVSLTHRDLSSSVAFVSGHSTHLQVPEADTLVYYMGASALSEIARSLLQQGRPSETPVLLVYNVSRQDQQEFFTTLGELQSTQTKYPTPLIALIGKVVGLRSHSAHELTKTILVTGTSAEAYTHLGKVTHTPLIELSESSEKVELAQQIAQLDQYRYLLFTSRYAVRYFFKELHALHKDTRALKGIRIVSIGKVTSEELNKQGITPDLQAEIEDSYGVLALFQREKAQQNEVQAPNGVQETQNILFPRSNLALPIIPEGLVALGYVVHPVVIYECRLPAQVEKVDLTRIHSIVFTSPSCIDNFLRIYGELPTDKEIIVRGRITQQRLNELRYEKI